MTTRATFPDATNPARLELEPAFSNVAVARRFVADHLGGTPVGEGLVGDLQLAASELVTNAVEHGEREPVVVEVALDACLVSLSVTSHSPRDLVGPVSDWAVASADEISGRGLGIVRTLADDVYVCRGDGQLTITLERRWH